MKNERSHYVGENPTPRTIFNEACSLRLMSGRFVAAYVSVRIRPCFTTLTDFFTSTSIFAIKMDLFLWMPKNKGLG